MSHRSSALPRSVEYIIGLEDKPPTPVQLDQMRELVRREMEARRTGHHHRLNLSARVLR